MRAVVEAGVVTCTESFNCDEIVGWWNLSVGKNGFLKCRVNIFSIAIEIWKVSWTFSLPYSSALVSQFQN